MKSKVFLLLAFVAVAQFASAQMSFRMGLDAGANMSFYKAEFAGLLKDYIVDDVKPAVSPSVGLNLALDFGIDKKKSFGFLSIGSSLRPIGRCRSAKVAVTIRCTKSAILR